jgi:hypothetical protein
MPPLLLAAAKREAVWTARRRGSRRHVHQRVLTLAALAGRLLLRDNYAKLIANAPLITCAS